MPRKTKKQTPTPSSPPAPAAITIPADLDPETNELLHLCLAQLDEVKALDIKVFDVRPSGIGGLFDVIVVATATSSRHGAAVADKLRYQLKHAGYGPLGFEGPGEMGWALLDAGQVVIHIMLPQAREHYDLEGLWGMDTPA